MLVTPVLGMCLFFFFRQPSVQLTGYKVTWLLLSSPLVQFNLLHSKFHLCSVPTRALLLSAYIKFINLFPETKATIQEVLRCDSQIRNSDVELQQRAVEYLKLSSIASTDVLVIPSFWIEMYTCARTFGLNELIESIPFSLPQSPQSQPVLLDFD